MRRKAIRALEYAAAAYLTLAVVIALLGWARPNVADVRALQRSGIEGTPVLIGLATAQEQTAEGIRFEDRRYYFIAPASLRARALWVVTEQNGAVPKVARSEPGFWTVSLLLLLSMIGTWRLGRDSSGDAG